MEKWREVKGRASKVLVIGKKETKTVLRFSA